MKDSDLTTINPFPFLGVMLVLYIPLLLSITACKSTKTHCDAYGDLKRQHDVYHGKEGIEDKEVTK